MRAGSALNISLKFEPQKAHKKYLLRFSPVFPVVQKNEFTLIKLINF